MLKKIVWNAPHSKYCQNIDNKIKKINILKYLKFNWIVYKNSSFKIQYFSLKFLEFRKNLAENTYKILIANSLKNNQNIFYN